MACTGSWVGIRPQDRKVGLPLFSSPRVQLLPHALETGSHFWPSHALGTGVWWPPTPPPPCHPDSTHLTPASCTAPHHASGAHLGQAQPGGQGPPPGANLCSGQGASRWLYQRLIMHSLLRWFSVFWKRVCRHAQVPTTYTNSWFTGTQQASEKWLNLFLGKIFFSP